MAKISSYFKISRLRDARGYLLLTLFGFLLAKGFLFPLKDIFLFWLIILLGGAFTFSINECFDQREDKFNKTKENLILSGKIGFKRALAFSLSLAFFGLFLTAFYGLKIFLFSLFTGSLMLFYSAPPLRFKSRPPFDLISHGLFGGSLIFFFPLLFFKTKINFFHYLIALSAFYFSILLELRNEYEDYQADKIGKLKTSAHIFGYQKTEKLLRLAAIFYPLFLLPIFYFFLSSFLFPFLALTIIFLGLFLFFKNYRLVKNYKLFDTYNFFAYVIILIGAI